MNAHVLDRLYAVVRARQGEGAPESYVATLTGKGPAKVRAKVLEEAGELLEASVRRESGADTGGEVVHEAADLLFHVLVLLGAQGIPAEAVWAELERRFGTGGLAEKAARRRKNPA